MRLSPCCLCLAERLSLPAKMCRMGLGLSLWCSGEPWMELALCTRLWVMYLYTSSTSTSPPVLVAVVRLRYAGCGLASGGTRALAVGRPVRALTPRARSTLLLLPQFRRKGHGARLVQCVYNHYIPRAEVLEVTVEDPSDAFARLRDFVDVRALLGSAKTRATLQVRCEARCVLLYACAVV